MIAAVGNSHGSGSNQLAPAWAMSLGGEKMRGQQATPLVKDGVMYVTGSYSRLWAIDTKTGKELWQYDHRLPEGIPSTA